MKDSSVNGVIPSRVGYFNSRKGPLVGMQLIRMEIFHLTLRLLAYDLQIVQTLDILNENGPIRFY